ncbi:alpha/beta hydrolase family esterase [Ramlibacter rhizophilus]|nr:PHB depolymerase family esterase [Ramlibacter rhizophilus]
MPRRRHTWAKTLERNFLTLSRLAAPSVTAAFSPPARTRARAVPGDGAWIAGVSMGMAGMRRFRLFRPSGMAAGERLPLMVMLHGCGQDAESFAIATRMNQLAARERFLVLYPEQDRMANQQRCWNWFDTRNGRAFGEVDLVLNAIDQACLLHGGDREQVAVAGLSAGASLAALLATRHPARVRAVVMHSGVPPGSADSTMGALRAMRGSVNEGIEAPVQAAAAWPPLLVIHGSSDRIVDTRNALAAVQGWAQAAGARPGTGRKVQRGKRYPMTVTDYKAARSRTVARLVEITGLGHAWSGGSRVTHSDPSGPDASRLAWAFAADQFARQEAMRSAGRKAA